MGWNPIDDIKDAFTDTFQAVGDFFQDPLGALEDAFNGALDIMTFGTWSYVKDSVRAFVAGLIPEQTYQDRERTVRSGTEPRQVIYGKVRTGGQIVYIEDQGKDNTILWMCFVLAGHRVEEIEAVRADGEIVATSNGAGINGEMNRPSGNSFGDNIVCWSVHGNLSTAFIPIINVDYTDNSYDGSFSPPNWTADHKLTFQSYVWVSLVFDKATFGDTGIPRFTFDVKGKDDIYDPRVTGSGYTDNHALIMLDILLWDRMFDEDFANIDMQDFIDAANVADEMVASGVGTTEKRYTVNGTFKLQAVPLEILQSVATAGAALPYFDVSSGRWKVTPGAYAAPVMSLDESDMVGGISFQAGPSKQNRHNVAKGTFIDANQDYEAVGFPELYVSDYVNDDLEVLEKSYDFPWTNTATMARRLAKIDIERNRFGVSCKSVFKFKALQLAPGDRVELTISRLGWSPKIFRVESVEISFNTGVALDLREDDPSIYAWEEGDALALDPPPAISIPDGLSISAPTGIAFSEEVFLSTGGQPRSQLNLSWGDQPSALAYDIQYRVQGATDWIDAASFWQDNNLAIRDISDGTYDFRIRAISRLGIRSDWFSTTYTVDGLTADVVTAVDLSELPYTPKDPDAVYSTVIVVVVPPADSDFSYADIEYRKVGQPEWKVAGPTDENQTLEVVLESDGGQYEFRAFSVADTGIRSSVSASNGITLSNATDFDQPNVWDQIEVPPVHGLELFGQGNDSEFGGRDAKFEWRKTSVNQWLPIGGEGFAGASGGNLDQYFRDYQVEVWADNKIVRTEFVLDPLYIYSYEKNAEDYSRENGTVGAWRSFELRVYCRSRVGSLSETPARLAVSNTAPDALSALSILSGYSVIEIAYKRPDDLDFAGVDIWISETSGFDPDVVEPTATVSDNSYVAGGLADGTSYYVRLRPFDLFGRTGTNTTAEISVATKTGQDLSGLSGWAYELDPADEAFINDNLAADAVPSEKIKNLTAAKITAGVINATETITSEGVIRAVDDINAPTVQTGLGPANLTVGGTNVTALLWSFNAEGVTFAIDSVGNPYFRGTIEASGFSNDNLDIDEQGNLTSSGTFTFGDVAGGEYVEFDGTNLNIQTPFFSANNASVVFGDNSTDQYVSYDGTSLEVGRDTELRGADSYNNNALYYHLEQPTLDKFFTSGTITIEGSVNSVDIVADQGDADSDFAIIRRDDFLSLSDTEWSGINRAAFKSTINLSASDTNTGVSGGNVASFIGVGDVDTLSWPTLNGTGFGFLLHPTDAISGEVSIYVYSCDSGAGSGVTLSDTGEVIDDLNFVGGNIGTRTFEAVYDVTDGEIKYYVGNVEVASITTNLPTTPFVPDSPFTFLNAGQSIISSTFDNRTLRVGETKIVIER